MSNAPSGFVVFGVLVALGMLPGLFRALRDRFRAYRDTARHPWVRSLRWKKVLPWLVMAPWFVPLFFLVFLPWEIVARVLAKLEGRPYPPRSPES